MRNKTTGTLSTAIINIWSFKVFFVIILRTYSFNFFMYYFSFKKGQRIKSHLMLCYLKFELKKSWLSTFIFSAPIFGYREKNLSQNCNLNRSLFTSIFLISWCGCGLLLTVESIVHAVAFKYIIFKLSDVSCIMKL